MSPMFLLPVLVGFAVVVQAGMNRQIADQWGLAGSALLNSAVVLGLAIVFYLLVRWRPELFPEFLRWPETPGHFAWWRGFVPGVLGITIVAGLPWAFSRLGALEVILSVLVAQVVASLFWDALVEKIPAHPLRVVGAMIALAGTALASWKR